jgi:hypothetical protein
MTIQFDVPWTYWITDNFLSNDMLAELKNISHKSTQIESGKRLSESRLFITEDYQKILPNLHDFYLSLNNGHYKSFFEEHTKQSYAGMFPRVEVVSDYGSFYLERHHDLFDKKLSALVYTNHEELHPGTLIYDNITEHHRIETKDNRCMFFNPTNTTWHGYPATTFKSVRRCLMINYWSYQA